MDTTKMILSPMPGSVFSVNVKVGETIEAGQEVCVVEAMKMQNSLKALAKGTVKEILVNAGDSVAADDVLVEFE